MPKYLGIVAVALLTFSSAHATPMLINPTEHGSDVSVQMTTANCLLCFVDTFLSDDLDEKTASLGVDDSVTFEFFDIVFGALIGGAHIELQALLALEIGSSTASAQATGIGAFASLFFVLNGIQLNWIQPDDIDLGDGTFLSVSFDNLFEIGYANTATVTATVSRHATTVPEPGTTALLIAGFLAMFFTKRRRLGRNSQLGTSAA